MIRIQRNSELAWREVGGETIVIHLGRKMMYGLNPAGGRVWNALENPATLEELQRLVPSEAGQENTARAAVVAFLADLEAEELITPDPALAPKAPALDGGSEDAHLPRIVWREEVRRFAGACLKYPGVSQICDQNPFNS